MKDIHNSRSVPTKSEYAALNDLIDWLKEQRGGEENPKVTIAYHDRRSDRVTPFLIEALQKYKLEDDFFSVVKGFVNLSSMVADIPEHKGRSLALPNLAKRGDSHASTLFVIL